MMSNPPEFLDRAIDRCLETGFVRHISADADRPATFGFHLGLSIAEGIPLQVEEGEIGAVLSEPKRDGLTDSLRRSGDECDLSCD